MISTLSKSPRALFLYISRLSFSASPLLFVRFLHPNFQLLSLHFTYLFLYYLILQLNILPFFLQNRIMFTNSILFGGFYMLRHWQSHSDYQQQLIQRLSLYSEKERSRLLELDKAISKLYLLNLDNLLPIVKPLYPSSGCPAKNQQGIIRSLVLMLELQVYSITKWAKRVQHDQLLFDICGFDSEKAPAVASYYDLLWRLWLASHKKYLKRKLKLRPFLPKPNKRFKANQKLPNKHPGIVKNWSIVL